MNLHASLEELAPECPHCGVRLDYGINTTYKEEQEHHICISCGHPLH